MSAQEAEISNDLGIEIDRATYHPGDTINGVVYRSSAIVSTEATIDLTLRGRAKSYIDYRSGSVTYTYRGEYALVREEQNLLQGPLHIPDKERQQWPFSFTIPTNIDARLYPGDHNAKISYLPLDADSVSKRALPSTFRVSYDGRKGSIEYFLEAKLKAQGHSSTKETAILPFRLVVLDPNPLSDDGDLQYAAEEESSVWSQRLVPGKENAELSASDKMKKFFGTASVPKLAYRFEVGVPKTVQLNHAPIHLTMRMIPNWSETSESIRNVPQKIKLLSFKASLKYKYHLVGSDSGDPYYDYAKDSVELLTDDAALSSIEIPLTAGDKPPPANVGTAVHLRLPDDAVPAVSTFNIKTHKQELSWKVKCEVAGETFSVSGLQKVTVLPASVDSSPAWMAPPDDAPPPSFADVQRQDGKKGASSSVTEYPKEKQ